MDQDKKPYDHSFTFKDNPAVMETFADGVHLVTMDGATGRIVFTVSRSDMPKTGNKAPTGTKTVAARLVLSANGFIELHNQLHRLISGMEQMGLVQREGGPSIVRN